MFVTVIILIKSPLYTALQFGFVEWLKNPPNGVLIYPWENLSSFTCDIPSSVFDGISFVAKRPNPWIVEFLIVKKDAIGIVENLFRLSSV